MKSCLLLELNVKTCLDEYNMLVQYHPHWLDTTCWICLNILVDQQCWMVLASFKRALRLILVINYEVGPDLVLRLIFTFHVTFELLDRECFMAWNTKKNNVKSNFLRRRPVRSKAWLWGAGLTRRLTKRGSFSLHFPLSAAATLTPWLSPSSFCVQSPVPTPCLLSPVFLSVLFIQHFLSLVLLRLSLLHLSLHLLFLSSSSSFLPFCLLPTPVPLPFLLLCLVILFWILLLLPFLFLMLVLLLPSVFVFLHLLFRLLLLIFLLLLSFSVFLFSSYSSLLPSLTIILFLHLTSSNSSCPSPFLLPGNVFRYLLFLFSKASSHLFYFCFYSFFFLFFVSSSLTFSLSYSLPHYLLGLSSPFFFFHLPAYSSLSPLSVKSFVLFLFQNKIIEQNRTKKTPQKIQWVAVYILFEYCPYLVALMWMKKLSMSPFTSCVENLIPKDLYKFKFKQLVSLLKAICFNSSVLVVLFLYANYTKQWAFLRILADFPNFVYRTWLWPNGWKR